MRCLVDSQGAVVEHRWGERVQVKIPVRLSVRPYAIGAEMISNLSLSGAWIRTNLKVPALARIENTFAAARSSRFEVRAVTAYVVRKDRHGIGLEWCELTPCNVRDLLLFLNAETAPARMREQSVRGEDVLSRRSARL
jgi:hypothetical protein